VEPTFPESLVPSFQSLDMGMLLPLLLALPLAGASALPCEEGTWYIESIGECVTDEERVARGREAREGGYCREVYDV